VRSEKDLSQVKTVLRIWKREVIPNLDPGALKSFEIPEGIQRILRQTVEQGQYLNWQTVLWAKVTARGRKDISRTTRGWFHRLPLAANLSSKAK
jgi:hypothetical protein